jgi:four helix bundle protein
MAQGFDLAVSAILIVAIVRISARNETNHVGMSSAVLLGMAEKTRQDLLGRAFVLAERVLNIYPRLAAVSPAHAHMALQLFRAATGIGALLEEGVVANSRRDMASKYAIALREARESSKWSRLIATDPNWTEEMAPVIQESKEFVAMLTVSVRKLRGGN